MLFLFCCAFCKLFPKAQQNKIVIPKTARAKARGQKLLFFVQGWQESTDAALTFLLRTSLAKAGKENQGKEFYRPEIVGLLA
jgi:hypothetical protein